MTTTATSVPERATIGAECRLREHRIRRRFIEQMEIVARGDGASRIAGRMMGLLIFDGRPYSLTELAAVLQSPSGRAPAWHR